MNFQKTPFESANARDHIPEILATQFVWTHSFERLLTPKNHIVLGARGSGKTALVKMLSHEYLSKHKDSKAREIIAGKKFIGTYVPMRLDWVGGLKNKPWLTEGEAEKYFQWRLNIVCCAALLGTLSSLLSSYLKDDVERIKTERTLAKALCDAWLNRDDVSSIAQLSEALADEEYNKLQTVQRQRILGTISERDKLIGANFEIDLFMPFKRGIALIKRFMKFPRDCVWCLALDEAEYLDELHHRILNSHLRTYADGIYFKITTKPYKHYTLNTNTNEPLNEKDDFEYVYIDQLSIARRSESEFKSQYEFATEIFNKRIDQSTLSESGLKLEYLLSDSYLLVEDYSSPAQREKIHHLILKWGNEKTQARAKQLYKTKQYDDQIGRKIKGALLLTEKVRSTKGNEQLDVYSGYQMIIKCADGNPRRLLGLYNRMLSEAATDTGFKPVALEAQHRIMRQFSHSELIRAKSEPDIGESVYSLLTMIGQFMRHRLHDQPISTDQIFSIKVDSHTENAWPVIEEAVGLGLLIPNMNQENPDRLPTEKGYFRIAYILAPHFMLLPRHGKSISLEFILSFGKSIGIGGRNSAQQLGLFK